MDNKNELIILEQLPIIKTHLEKLSVEIKEKVDKAVNLVCTEDTVKDVKNVRAELNKEFKELEAQRKEVKNAIMAKYNDFESIYSENVSSLYKNADIELKSKIDSVEDELKLQKLNEVRDFFYEHCKANNIDVDFERANINVTLSASMKSLKEQALAFIEDIVSDLKLIDLEEYKDEILLEYNNTLDFASAKITVVERHKKLEEMQKVEPVVEEVQEEVQEIIEEEISAPVEINEPDDEEPEEQMMVVAFQVTGTKQQLRELKQFLQEKGIKYE